MKVFSFNAEFASQVINEIPFGYINKTVCGCGLTTVALENEVSTIIAVPTIYLAANKAMQYPNNRCSYNILNVWGETTARQIDDYVLRNDVLKIMCTYDALPKVEHLIKMNVCRLVIDECNEIRKLYKSSRSGAAHNLFRIAEQYKDVVSFISATPLDVKYLPRWISGIEQVVMNWENTIKSKPILFKRTYPFKSLANEILKPLKNEGEISVANKIFNNVVVFINSVEKIKEVIKMSELNLDECRIICGDSLKNDVKIVGIKRYDPSEGCKYLFVTASGFCGIDIYMENAMTVIVSNTTRSWQMVDMLTDLKQAVSRMRNKENPNYGSYIYIYNQSIFEKTEEELLEELDSIKSNINDGVDLYNYAVSNDKLKGFTASDDFVNYSMPDGDFRVIDEDAFKADMYFILETRNQYTKGFDISSALENSVEIDPVIVEGSANITYKDLVNHFRLNNKNGVIEWGEYSDRNEWISIIETSYKFYKTTWMNISEAKEMIDNYGDQFELLKIKIIKAFVVGKEYTRADVKDKLQQIYNEVAINRKAKHTDLCEVMTIRDKKVKGERMVEIISK